jgi:hypothetical protein
MAYGNVSVLTTATLIVAANCRRKSLHLVNASLTKPIYIGPDASITTVTGFPLYENSTRDQAKIPEGWLGAVYGIVASTTADLRYWEVTNG